MDDTDLLMPIQGRTTIIIPQMLTTSLYSNSTNSTAKSSSCPSSVHDIEIHKTFRIVTLYLTIIIGTIGGVLVLLWMICNRRLKARLNHLSRVNSLILNLTFADLSVIFLAVLPQLIWEYVDREWVAGEAMCKIVKFLQSFSMMSSNYVLVVIAIDRHQAIRAPLKEPIPVWKMAGAGWCCAALLSVPMFFLFHTNINKKGVPVCENIFRDLSLSYRQAFLTFIAIVVFFIPLVILVVCYTRIFVKIARKANEGARNKRTSLKSGKVHLQSTPSSSLPRAKIKTLKMTFVIICVFIVCSLPYFIAEMIMSYGDYCLISKELVSVLAGLAPSNSATNPFVFLLFNANIKWIKDLKACGSNKRSPQRGYVYSSTSTANTHYYVHGNGAQIYQPTARVNHERLQMYSVNRSSLVDQSIIS